MGCGAPSIHEKAVEFQLNASQATELVVIMKFLGLTWQEVDRIHASFSMMDLDSTRSVDRDELTESLNAENSLYAKDAFRVFDRNHDGSLDFVEFLIAATKLCCADHENLCRFAFRMVDKDGSGEIDKSELQTIVHNIYGEQVAQLPPGSLHGWKAEKKGKPKPPRKPRRQSVDVILQNLDIDNSGTLSIDEFIHAATKFPQLIEPAFQMQTSLRDKVVNRYFWVKREERIRKKFANVIKQQTHEKNAVRNYIRKFSDPKTFDTKKASTRRKIQPMSKMEQTRIVGNIKESRKEEEDDDDNNTGIKNKQPEKALPLASNTEEGRPKQLGSGHVVALPPI